MIWASFFSAQAAFVFVSSVYIFRQERGFDFLDGQTDGRTDRNFVEILGKLCFARLKLNF
jgi:hypothetical protein